MDRQMVSKVWSIINIMSSESLYVRVWLADDFDNYDFDSLHDDACTLKGVKDKIKEKRGGGSILLYFRGGHEIRFNDSLPVSYNHYTSV